MLPIPVGGVNVLLDLHYALFFCPPFFCQTVRVLPGFLVDPDVKPDGMRRYRYKCSLLDVCRHLGVSFGSQFVHRSYDRVDILAEDVSD